MDNPWVAYRAQEHCHQFMQEARQERLSNAARLPRGLAQWARAWQVLIRAIQEPTAVKRDSQTHPWSKIRPATR